MLILVVRAGNVRHRFRNALVHAAPSTAGTTSVRTAEALQVTVGTATAPAPLEATVAVPVVGMIVGTFGSTGRRHHRRGHGRRRGGTIAGRSLRRGTHRAGVRNRRSDDARRRSGRTVALRHRRVVRPHYSVVVGAL